MTIEIVRATYTERSAIEKFLTSIFGEGNTSVKWNNGKYNCTLPRNLTEAEKQKMGETVNMEHYEQTESSGTG